MPDNWTFYLKQVEGTVGLCGEDIDLSLVEVEFYLQQIKHPKLNIELVNQPNGAAIIFSRKHEEPKP